MGCGAWRFGFGQFMLQGDRPNMHDRSWPRKWGNQMPEWGNFKPIMPHFRRVRFTCSGRAAFNNHQIEQPVPVGSALLVARQGEGLARFMRGREGAGIRLGHGFHALFFGLYF